MTEKIKHIVFDLDGVLVDSEPLHEMAWSEILRGYGKAFEDNEFKQWVGGTDRARGEYLIKKHNLPIHSEDLLWAKRRMYLEIAQRQLKPFPHVKEGLIWLKECNFQMAVATSSFKQAVTVALTTTGLIDFFDIIVSADDVERHKPHPDSYLKAVENLRIPPQLSYAIEDSASGIKAAKTAGLFTIGVMNSFEKTILHEADLILADTISAIGWILNKYANNELIVVSHLGVCIGYLSGIIAFIATVSYVVVQVLQVMDVLTNPLDEILIYGTSLCI